MFTYLNGKLIPQEEEIAPGITLTRCGKYRILHIFNASIGTDGYMLNSEDLPKKSIGTAASVKASSSANLYVTVDTAGKVALFNNGKLQSVASGLIATLGWYTL